MPNLLRISTNTLLSLALGGTALFSSPAQAGVIFSDFSPGQTFTLSEEGRIVAGTASSFPEGNDPAYSFTASSDASVSQIDLGLSLAAGSELVASLWTAAPGCGTGIFVSFCNGLVPTTELGSWAVTSSTPDGVSITGITGIDLTDGSAYFLQLTAGTPTSYGIWANNLVGATSILWQCGGDSPCAGDATIGTTTAGTFDVLSPSSAVPEPTSVWLFMIGLGLIAFGGRRQLMRKQRVGPENHDTLIPHRIPNEGRLRFMTLRQLSAQRTRRRTWELPVTLAFLCGSFALPVGAATLIGLTGVGGGGTFGPGLVFAGTGFSNFDLATHVPTFLHGDTNQYVATAFAFNPTLNVFYAEKNETDGFHLVTVNSGGIVSETTGFPLPLAFKFFVYDAATNSLLGLAGSGGGSFSDVGIVSAGTGFYSLNLSTNGYQTLALDTNQYVNTAFAFDPGSQNLYVERTNTQVPATSFQIVAVNAAGGESNIGLPLPTNFIFFAFNSTTNSLIGFGGSGAGGLSGAGLVSAGTGFFTFDLSAGVQHLLISDANSYVNTAFAFDQDSQTLYAEQANNQVPPTSFLLVAVTATGGELSVGVPDTVFKFFVEGPCPINVSPSRPSYGFAISPYMQATFQAPNGMTLSNYAMSCGFDYFNWQQQFTVDPGGVGNALIGKLNPIPTVPANVPNNVNPDASCASLPSMNWPGPNNCALVAGPMSATGLASNYPPYSDPPAGGYTYFKDPTYNPFPSYYPKEAVTIPLGSCTFPDDKNPSNPNDFCLLLFPWIVNGDNATHDTTLSFLDAPVHPSLPGDLPSTTPTKGHFLALTTSLVGVSSQPNQGSVGCGTDSTGNAIYCATLYSWSWNTTFNGTAGGTSQSVEGNPVDPGSGTGGVTITSINGVPLPAVILPSQVATTSSGLAFSRVSQTFNGTMTLRNISGSAISGPLQIVLFGMPATVTLVNATANLSGTPYLTVPAVTSLAPGQSATVNVQFKNPSNVTLNLSPVIYSGSIN